MTKHAFLIALFFLLLLAAPAEAQRPLCGGHFITWTGGAPAPSRAPASADRRPDARYDPTHEDGQQPTIEEPAGLNRELWDALVFDEWQRAYRDYSEQTIVLAREAVPDINICIQSPDTSTTGELLEPFSNADWWREHIHRWTGINWNGEIRIAACTDGHRDGWINVRAGRPGEVRGVAHTVTERARHPHRVGRWISSDIIWNPGLILALIGESRVEKTLAHELGHALGFWHVPPGFGYVMTSPSSAASFPEEESDLAQLAYEVGPNVPFPGLVREGLEVDSPDRTALMELYDATGGSNWTDSANWDTDEPVDRWKGVRTDEEGRVVELNLHVNNLTGSIPAALGDLTDLERLELYENALSGPIPSEMGKLVNLQNLRLDRNRLSGKIPPELGNLTNLSDLDLERNTLTGEIPAEIGGLTTLDSLDFRRNNLTGAVPPEFGDLSNVRNIKLSNNQLTSPLPLSMTKLTKLDLLWMHNNAGLCAPADEEFQELLEGVSFQGEVCAQEVPALPFASSALLTALLAVGAWVRRKSR